MYCTNLSLFDEGNCDKRAGKFKLVHLTCLLIEFNNVVNFVDSQSYGFKMFSTLNKTSKFLETLRSFYKTFSVHEKRKIMSCSIWKVRVIYKRITGHQRFLSRSWMRRDYELRLLFSHFFAFPQKV